MKRSLLVAILLSAGALGSSAFAQTSEGQPYVGLAGGGSHLSGGCSSGVSCNNNGTAFKIYGGWAFPGDLAAELTYYDLGKFTASAAGVSADLRGSYWGLGGAWRPQFTGSNWGGVVRLGAADDRAKLDVSGVGSQTHDSWHPYLGLGLTYAVSKQLKVEADYDWTRLANQFTDTTGATTTATNNVSTYMIGASYAF